MNYQRELGFEVWAEQEHGSAVFLQCVAAFYYWQECLDYKDYALKYHACVVIRTLETNGKTWRSEKRESK